VTAIAEATGTGRNVPLDPGSVVGPADDSRWQVRRHIAEGRFSSVYEVRPATVETRLRHGAEPRALKCPCGTPAELSRAADEAATMAAVEGHDNVLSLLTSFRFDDGRRLGLVLELADEDVTRFAGRVRPPERAWAAVFEHAAAALEHLHARRVVHGAVTPANVLRIGARFALADAGISTALEAARPAGTAPASTIAYLPPESAGQIGPESNGERRPPRRPWRATKQADVWALAVTMHRTLTGRHVAAGGTPEQQYEQVCRGRIRIDEGLEGGWRQLLADCLTHEPDQRVVTSAAQLRRRLAELALSDDYAGVPWTDRQPRMVAVLDLGGPTDRPAAALESPTGDDPAPATDLTTLDAGATAGEVLVLYLTREGGRVHGRVIPSDSPLLPSARHLSDVVVPALAQQVRDSQRAVVRLAAEQQQRAQREQWEWQQRAQREWEQVRIWEQQAYGQDATQALATARDEEPRPGPAPTRRRRHRLRRVVLRVVLAALVMLALFATGLAGFAWLTGADPVQTLRDLGEQALNGLTGLM
jgi:Protein kinase domain